MATVWEQMSEQSSRISAVHAKRQREKRSHAARQAKLRELERELSQPAKATGEPTAADIARLRERGERQRRKSQPPARGAHESLLRAFVVGGGR